MIRICGHRKHSINRTNQDKLAELRELDPKPFRWTDATNPAQWQSSEPEDGALIMTDGEDGESYVEWWIIPGVLYICNYGCAIRFFMVVDGPQAGEVWIDRQADGKGIIPERGEDGSRLHFLQGYEN